MAIIKKYSPLLNLSKFQTFINDTNPNSDYFRITEFNETLSGGKCGFLIEGTPYLKETTEIKIEVLDVEGNPIYFEPGNGIPEYYEGTSILVSIHIYNDTPIGVGKITILGEAKTYKDINGAIVKVPSEWDGVYNVKWEKEFKINKLLLNEDKVRFYKRPLITIDEIVKPIFTVTIPYVTQTGIVEGIPEFPPTDTNLSNWSAGTLYKLKTDGITHWSSSQDEATITIPELNYSATVKEVLNSRFVLVDRPYTENNIVKPFPAAAYTSSFDYTEAQVYDASALTGSYANIKISQLKTFVGDVARVKVYRRSKNSVGDFQFIQETKLESTELLRDLTINTENQISYGNFTDSNLTTYWTSSNSNHPVTIDDTILNRSVFIDYNTIAGGVQRLETINTIPVSEKVEYTLSFKSLLNGTPSDTKTLKAYISSSTFQQVFAEITSSNQNLQRVLTDTNIITTHTDDVKLVFEFTGDDWYISNVSLRNAAETSFSPDEFNLIQEVPRQLPIETYDFKFEFYDINNNYIPVDVRATKEFTGGNTSDSSQLTKFLTFTSDRTAFRFITGSIGNPEFQQVGFKVTKNLLTGSVTYGYSAYDDSGTYIEPSTYVGQYPGLLTNPSDSGATLTISNFTGSDDLITVGSIVYTASLEDRVEYETIYRFVDAINISTIFASANSNQFFYEPTQLALRPTSQAILIQVERYNLDSNITPITVNSGSGKPPLTTVSDVNGKKTYQILGSNYPHSAGITTYEFTGSDAFGGEHSDSLTITPLINFDGVSVNLTNETTSFKSLSTGYVTPTEYDQGDGQVFVSVGTVDIAHENGLLSNNKFDIISASGINCTPNEVLPTTAVYGISNMSADAATLTLLIRYKAGDGSTIDFTKKVNYVKAKAAKPNVEVYVTPNSQTLTANYFGSGSNTPDDITAYAYEGGIDSFDNFGTIVSTGGLTFTSSSNWISFTSTATDMTDDSGSLTIPINYTDSEGTPGTKMVVANVNRLRNNERPVFITTTPQSQTLTEGGSVLPIRVRAQEGSLNYNYDATLSGSEGFAITYVSSGSDNGDGTITPTTPSPSDTTIIGSVLVDYVTSEGNLITGVQADFNLTYVATGHDAKTVKLSPSTYWILYDMDDVKLPGQVLTLSGSTQNFDNPYYQFTANEVQVQGYSTTTTYTVPAGNHPAIGETIIYQVNVKEGGVGDVVSFDNLDVNGISAASDAYSVKLTNETHAFPASNFEVVNPAYYSDGAFEVLVKRGIVDYTYDPTGVAVNSYSSSLTLSGISGTITTSVNNNLVFTPTVITTQSGYVDVYINDNSNDTDFTVRYTFSKALAGTDARTVKLSTPSYVITYDVFGNNPTPSTLLLTGSAQNFYTPYFKFSGDGIPVEGSYTVGSGSIDSASFSAPSTYFGTPKELRVGVSDAYIDSNVEQAYDTISIFAVKPGADGEYAESWYINSLSGSVLKNSQGTLELQAVYVSGSTLTNLSSGTVQFYDENDVLLSVGGGITAGTNGVTYNPIIDATALLGSEIFKLKNGSGDVLDTISLFDITDGLVGGVVLANNLHTRRVNTGTTLQPVYVYDPISLPASASFWGTDGTQYIEKVTLYPSYSVGSDLDYMYYSIDSDNANITLVVDDGDGTNFVGAGLANKLPTKDINLTFEFTDPQTSLTNNAIETFYVISDGADGEGGYTTFLTNSTHAFPADYLGNVAGGDLAAGAFEIRMYRGAQLFTYATGTAINTYSIVSTTPTGIAVTQSTVGSQRVFTPTSVTANTGTVVVVLKDNFTNTEFTQTYTFSKAIAGAPGSSGTDAKVVSLTTTSYAILYDANGNNPSPSGTLTLTATQQNATTPLYKFTGDGVSDDASYLAPNTKSYTIPSTFATFGAPDTIRVGLSDTNQTEVAYDTITIVGIKSGTNGAAGSPAVSGLLTNESHTVAATSTGTGYSLTGAGGTFQLFYGTTDVTSGFGSTYSGTTTKNGLTFTINASTGVYSLSGASWTTDTESFTATGTYTTAITKVYTISKSKAGVTPVKNVDYFDGVAGTNGPGVVHTGLWVAGRSYQLDLTPGVLRRDTVLYSGVYYMCTQTHTSTASGTTGPPTVGSYWSSLGAGDFFVAAKIAIFNDSYIQNTLNIGTNNSGLNSAANITLNGNSINPYMSMGQSATYGSQTYGANGVWMGITSTVGKLSLVNGTTAWLKWDGSSLDIKGSITVTNPGSFAPTNAEANPSSYSFGPDALFDLATMTTPSTAGLYLGGNNMGYYAGGWKTYMDSSGNFFLGGGSGVNYLSWNGSVLNIVGGITATTGAIGGWKIDSTSIYTGTEDHSGYTTNPGDITLYSNGTDASIHATQFYIDTAGSAFFKGSITGGSILIGGTGFGVDSSGNMWTGGSLYSNATFKVASTGNVSTTGNISFGATAKIGQLDASGYGSGGWYGDATKLSIWPEFFDPNNFYLFPQTYAAGGHILLGDTALKIKGRLNVQPGGSILQWVDIIGPQVLVTGTLYVTGNITAYYSDERLKTNLGNITNPLDKINSLNGFNYVNNELANSFGYTETNQQVGVSAQDIQKVIPEVVALAPFDNDGGGKSKSGEDYLTVDYARLVPLLIEGIKELSAKVDKLEEEIKKLKG